jgi:hypothetical protein
LRGRGAREACQQSGRCQPTRYARRIHRVSPRERGL